MNLFNRLQEYNNKNPYRFHMPGHKGRLQGFDLYGMDITEIPGMDDLHEPAGIIRDMEQRLASLYGASSAHFLVNGTTLGIMCGIFAMVQEGDRVLVQRNSHRCVYNGLMLRKAEPVFINTGVDKYGIPKAVSAAEVEEILRDIDSIKLAILTNPTYEGVVTELKDISAILRDKRIPLLVDAAHGAHFGFFEETENPVNAGADIAVESLHKTLPFLTQSSVLLYSKNGEKYRERVKFYLNCFESSSPSYILMAAGDKGIDVLEEQGERLFKGLEENLEEFYNRASNLSHIRVVESKNRDRSKIIITLENAEGATIREIYEELLSRNIVPEMMNNRYILCMTSLMNTREDMEALLRVLEEMDEKLVSEKRNLCCREMEFIHPKAAMAMAEAINEEGISIPFREALGKISGDFVEIFPPGIPLILPGEIIDTEVIESIESSLNADLEVRGISNGKIICINGEKLYR